MSFGMNNIPSVVEREALGTMRSLRSLDTPCLLLDEARMNRNIGRLRDRLASAGVGFSPHLKTAKSPDVARRLITGPHGPATVSTLREAEEFAAGGITDLTYAVGISPCKLPRVQAIRRRGVTLTILLDSVEQAEAVAASSDPSDPIRVLIELDCDGHRSGVRPGTHISAMGADAEGKQELDPARVASATLFADVVSQSITMGEYEAAYKAGLIDESRITPIGAVLNGTAGRASDDQVTIFDSSGMALQDIAICSLALEKAAELDLATNV